MKYNVWVDIEQEDEDGILSKFDDGESVATFDNEKDATEHAAQLGSLKPKADKPLFTLENRYPGGNDYVWQSGDGSIPDFEEMLIRRLLEMWKPEDGHVDGVEYVISPCKPEENRGRHAGA